MSPIATVSSATRRRSALDGMQICLWFRVLRRIAGARLRVSVCVASFSARGGQSASTATPCCRCSNPRTAVGRGDLRSKSMRAIAAAEAVTGRRRGSGTIRRVITCTSPISSTRSMDQEYSSRTLWTTEGCSTRRSPSFTGIDPCTPVSLAAGTVSSSYSRIRMR